jgi:hypothetical protein
MWPASVRGQGNGCDKEWTIKRLFLAGARRFYFIQNGLVDSGAQPTSYSMNIVTFFPRGKAAGA